MYFKLVAVLIAASQLASARFTSPADAYNKMSPGWNLGNTLDGIPSEGDWGNAPVTAQVFRDIRTAGFKSVRIPITWTHHFAAEAPSYNVTKTWLDRVATVVDMALAEDFWVIVNVHHDSWEWADFSQPSADKYTKFNALWAQIADRLKLYGEKVIFEPLNEPVGDTAVAAQAYNDLNNNQFLPIIRKSGPDGFNSERTVSLPSMRTNAKYASDWFVGPTASSEKGKWHLHVHNYSPWDFSQNVYGRTFWGTESDKQAITDELALSANKVPGIPVVIGEFGILSTPGPVVEIAAAYAWFDHFVRAARSFNMVPMLWDNGQELFDRPNRRWRDPAIKDIVINAAKGIVNTIPFNGNSTVWLKQGKTITAEKLNFSTNGNTITSVLSSSGAALSSAQCRAVC